MIRDRAGLPISRFALVLGISRRTYTWRLHARRHPAPGEHPSKRRVRDRITPLVERYQRDHPTWGYRRIWRQSLLDGVDLASPTSVSRAVRDLDGRWSSPPFEQGPTV